MSDKNPNITYKTRLLSIVLHSKLQDSFFYMYLKWHT